MDVQQEPVDVDERAQGRYLFVSTGDS